MVGASVLNQPLQFLAPQQNHEINFSLKEQECISLMKKCNNMEEFKQIHGLIMKLGLFYSSFCATNIVSTCALSQWGSMDYAHSVFQQIDNPTSFEFNTMIRGYIKDLNAEEAIFTYIDMLEIGVRPDNFTYPAVLKAIALLSALGEGMQIHGHIVKLGFVDDVFVQNSLISMYGKCGRIRRCLAVFEDMEQRSVASWSALIAAHASLGMWGECVRLFSCMNWENCWRPEESTLVSVLCACTHLGVLDWGRCVHGYILRNLSGFNVALGTSSIDMYITCGSIDKGMCLFREMKERNLKSYSVVVSGLAIHGCGEKAISVFEEMLEEGLEPDDVVYVGVLSACSHAGLVETGMRYFDRMTIEHGIRPTVQHYGCMVDLMGRAGMVNEAFELIKSMPMEPNDVIWRSLLNSCRVHRHVELGETAAKKLFSLRTQNVGDYIMLCNIYAQAQRWHDVSMIRTKMACTGSGQAPGSSSVEVKNKFHMFMSNDRSHPQCGDIYEMIHQMEWQLKFEGYKPDTTQVLLDVDEEEKRERLSSHSQKLAIAFSLINTSEGSSVKIVRNIRMCSDCHTYTKLISMIYEREITVRDRNIFHHFRDGTCSCKDYW
ncbi:hypothetical protein BUALT_Bualt10G0069700 [Buddleja alternifolia]|uniref:DYW domain-containing protein n=1 Tax=Buddleja alternifolia TaxID=168488 RepID=A0AAV6X7K8_9LAMI|nr:hypothetical protein BUALT_Bualt10G0069700 [Buddleja alternifolia]